MFIIIIIIIIILIILIFLLSEEIMFGLFLWWTATYCYYTKNDEPSYLIIRVFFIFKFWFYHKFQTKAAPTFTRD